MYVLWWFQCGLSLSFLVKATFSLFVLLSFFSFGHCVVCSSAVCEFWLLFGIFKLFLFMMTTRTSLCLSSRLHGFRCYNMSPTPTLDRFRGLLVTNLAALRWTISIGTISHLLHRSHAEEAYPDSDLIRDIQALYDQAILPYL